MPLTDPLVCPACKGVLRHSVPPETQGGWKPWAFICPTHGRFFRTASGLRPVGPIARRVADNKDRVSAPNRTSLRGTVPEMFARFTDQFLKHLTAVAVRVDSTAVSMSHLAGEIEQRLRQTGIGVMPPAAPHDQTTLRMNIAVTAANADQSSVRTRAALSGWVYVTCGGGRGSERVMWSGQRLQVVSNADIDTCVRQDVECLVDLFAAKYQAAHQPA